MAFTGDIVIPFRFAVFGRVREALCSFVANRRKEEAVRPSGFRILDHIKRFGGGTSGKVKRLLGCAA